MILIFVFSLIRLYRAFSFVLLKFSNLISPSPSALRVKDSNVPCLIFLFFMQRKGVFFISGDVHFGEISRYDCATGYPLYDITSSGLTQAVEKVVPPSLNFIVRFVAWLTPTTMRVMSRNCRFKSCTYGMECLLDVSLLTMSVVGNIYIYIFKSLNLFDISNVNFLQPNQISE